jgi:hypothetical protein
LENKSLPQLSFVVPLFNHLDHSKVTLAIVCRHLFLSGLGYESCLWLTTPRPTVHADGWLSLDDPQLRVVLNASNLGFARTTNAGIAKADWGHLGAGQQ